MSRFVRWLVGERRWNRLKRTRALARTAENVRLEARHRAARLYRRALLRRVTVIGVTGSAGKTVAKELLHAILSRRLSGAANPGGRNISRDIARTLLTRARPWHRFCLLEVGLKQSPLDRSVALVAPDVAVVTTVGTDHISAFRTIEAIAAEKGKLVAALPLSGTAVLNADDVLVLGMRERCRGGRVLTYGMAPGADVRAEDVQGRWPDRLAFTVVHGNRSYPVRTQLCGVHWVPSVLAALTAGLAMGVELAEAAEVVATVPPFPGRLSPVSSPDGVTFVRDDIKAPLWSIPLALRFLEDARASRKILVIGTISDYLGNSGRKYLAVARQALAVADHVVFVGPNASRVLKVKRSPGDGTLHAASHVDSARLHLERVLQPGDLVLLKGSRADGLEALVDTRLAPSTGPAASQPGGSAPEPTGRRVDLIVGLGNPGERYADTPHNAGQRALDQVASILDVPWSAEDDALVARVDHAAGTVYLVKPLTPMNASGPALRRLADRLGVDAAHCLLLQDDIDLPVGAVRTRMTGGDGGHRGVRSVLEAFQSHAVRRVKIGVGRPASPADVVRHVVGQVDPRERASLEAACAEAAARALTLSGLAPARASTADGRCLDATV